MTVCVAYVHEHEVTYSWHASMLALLAYDIDHDRQVCKTPWIATRYGTGGLPHARNQTVHTFLTERTDDWLLWVDTDMGFRPDAVDRLLDVGHRTQVPMVGALAFMALQVAGDDMGGWIVESKPTLFDWQEDIGGFAIRDHYDPNELTEVDATGSAFVLIHRTVFEQVQDKFGPSWYSPVTGKHGTFGEDMGFCLRVKQCGIPIHVLTSVKTSHFKPVWLDERLHDRIEDASTGT